LATISWRDANIVVPEAERLLEMWPHVRKYFNAAKKGTAHYYTQSPLELYQKQLTILHSQLLYHSLPNI